MIREDNFSEKVSKAEGSLLNTKFVPLESNYPVKKNLKGVGFLP